MCQIVKLVVLSLKMFDDIIIKMKMDIFDILSGKGDYIMTLSIQLTNKLIKKFFYSSFS